MGERTGRTGTASLLVEALRQLRVTLLAVSAMSGVINLLALTGSFYMLQVYDRVLTSYSIPTLIVFSGLAIGLYVIQGVLDVLRAQVLVRVGNQIDRSLMPVAHAAALRLPLFGASDANALQPVRDVDTVRGFLGTAGPTALLDLPWFPIYLIFVFFLHQWLGFLAVFGVIVLIALTFATEHFTAGIGKEATRSAMARQVIVDGQVRNAEVIRAMGIGGRAARRFDAAHEHLLKLQSRSSDLAGSLSGVSKVFRMMMQSAVLGLGAYLTVKGQITGGAIIAASIASSRALAPIEMAIANWKSFIGARQALGRLHQSVAALPPETDTIDLNPPSKTLRLEGITVPVPGTQRVVLSNVSFELSAGQAVGVIGPSAAGKSTLARAIVGVWPLLRGSVRLDGASLDQWNLEALGSHIGYLPQDVELFDGTIAENISRFVEDPVEKSIIAAAEAADCHDLITRLPGGYEARIGPGGTALSAGQRQRVGLARALFGEPFLVVLDEPNSNLDAEGEAALAKAIQGVRNRKGIVVMIAHRPAALAACDMAAMIAGGQMTAFGPRDEVLKKVLRVA